MYADKYKKIKYTDNNIQIYKIDENKTNINNYSINLSDSMKDTSNILVNFYSNFQFINENNPKESNSEFNEFKINISKFDTEILDLKKAIKENDNKTNRVKKIKFL